MMDIFGDRPYVTTRDGRSFHYINKQNDMLRCWRVCRNINGAECHIVLLNVVDFHEKDLKEIGVWESLGDVVQNTVLKLDSNEPIEKPIEQDKLETKTTVKKKKNRFKNLPDVITCKCGRETKANYSYLSAKADKLEIPLQQLIDEYQCQKCNPTKGRRKNESTSSEDHNQYPEFLVCPCGKKVKLNIDQLSKKSKKKDIPIQKLIDDYQCQTCNPTKGRKKKETNDGQG